MTSVDLTGDDSILKSRPPEDERGGGGSGWKLLMVASDHFTAHLVEGRLMDEGIETFLDKFNTATGAFLKPFGDPLAPVRIFVKEFDFANASLVLLDAGQGTLEPEEVRPIQGISWAVILSIGIVGIIALIILIESFSYFAK